MSTPFSTHALIRTVLSETDLVNPREIAEKVAEATPQSELREAYTEALVGSVRNVLSSQRNAALQAVATADHSPKIAARRDWWSSVLASRIFVGTSWTTLGQCTADNLSYAAAERRKDAQREIVRAGTYDTLREALATHHVETVADLPADVLAPVLRTVAA